MTDAYDSNQKDHEAGAHHDHDVAEGQASDAWHGDQPPVDDFADAEQGGEETATVHEETTTGEEAAAEATTARRKSSVVLPITAAMGGLLFLGAMLYWQFGNPAQQPAQQNAALQSQANRGVPPLQPASPVPTGAMPSAQADITALKQPTPESVTPTTAMAPVVDGMPAPSASATPSSTGTATPTTGSDSSAALVPPPNAVPAPVPAAPALIPPTSAPTTPSAPATTAAVVPSPVSMPSVTSVNPSPAPASTSANAESMDGRLAALAARVEDLQKSLAQTTQQLSQVSMMAAAPQAASASSNPAVEDRLNKIEQQLNQLQNAPSSPPAAPIREVRKTSRHATHHASHVSRHASRHRKATKKIAHKTAHHKNTEVASVASGSWVLRAASPDEAYISRNSSSSDLQPIHVGDSVAGIGQVRAIRQDGDRWVVEGSQGTIR